MSVLLSHLLVLLEIPKRMRQESFLWSNLKNQIRHPIELIFSFFTCTQK